MTVVYNPKAFILHAVSLRQACAHCGRFSAAATRRCMVRVAVPSVGNRLSPPLGRHRLGRPLPCQLADSPEANPGADCSFTPQSFRRGDHRKLVRLSADYARLRGMFLCITTSFAASRVAPCGASRDARLACLIHVASVHPEPGSNSN